MADAARIWESLFSHTAAALKRYEIGVAQA